MNEQKDVLDAGPFFHGTKVQLKLGEGLGAAKWRAELAAGDAKERIYLVEPPGDFENDPNLTDKLFPGKPTRS